MVNLDVWNNEEISEMQLKDPGIKQILVWKLEGRTVPPGNEICSLNEWKNLVLDGLFYLKGNNSLGLPFSRPVAPCEIRYVVFQHLHTNRTGGHLGRDGFIEAIRRRFYWPKQNDDIN